MLDEDLSQLMRPRKVCLCHQVSRADIEAVLEKGGKTLDDVRKATRATTGCGTCVGAVERIILDHEKKRDYPLFSGDVPDRERP